MLTGWKNENSLQLILITSICKNYVDSMESDTFCGDFMEILTSSGNLIYLFFSP